VARPLTDDGFTLPHRIIRNWHAGRLLVGYYIWYSDEGTGRAAVRPGPSSLYQMLQPTHQRPV